MPKQYSSTASFIFSNFKVLFMKEGAYIGGIIALLVYFMLPLYGSNGEAATIMPTGNVVSSPSSFSAYVSNLPYSMLIFFALEIVGISVGMLAQRVLSKSTEKV